MAQRLKGGTKIKWNIETFAEHIKKSKKADFLYSSAASLQSSQFPTQVGIGLRATGKKRNTKPKLFLVHRSCQWPSFKPQRCWCLVNPTLPWQGIPKGSELGKFGKKKMMTVTMTVTVTGRRTTTTMDYREWLFLVDYNQYGSACAIEQPPTAHGCQPPTNPLKVWGKLTWFTALSQYPRRTRLLAFLVPNLNLADMRTYLVRANSGIWTWSVNGSSLGAWQDILSHNHIKHLYASHKRGHPLFFYAVAPPSWSVSRGAGKQCRLAHVAKSKHQTSAARRLLGSFHCLHRLHRLHRFHCLHWCLRFHMSERKGCRNVCFLALKSTKSNTS